MSVLRRGVLLLASAAIAVPSAAQVAPGHTAEHTELVSRKSRTDKISRCVLGRARSASITLVEDDPKSAEVVRSRGSIKQALGGCMSARDTSLTVSVEDLAGNLAELLLKENNGALLAAVKSANAVPAARVAGTPESTDQAVFDCAAAARPSDAATLIDNAPESAGEASAFRAMIPALQACVPADYALQLKPYQVRSLAAIGLYRRVTERGAS